jgi:very-short-patch-repair endonuclease
MPYQRQQPSASPIEVAFWNAAKPRIPELQREYWIDNKYRVDFIIPSKKLVTELYGYRYHNSKEKLAKDAERERYLQLKGYQVIRFTGSEVYRRPQYCVDQVLAIASKRQTAATMDTESPPPVVDEIIMNPATPVGSSALPQATLFHAYERPKSTPFLRLQRWQQLFLGALLLMVLAAVGVLTVLMVSSASQPMPTLVPASTSGAVSSYLAVPTANRIRRLRPLLRQLFLALCHRR